ncbi:fimbrial protein [Serratia sp. DD3]|uniref:fimbrial protein n=1 Tax=Serratia sp. DD3 TaxID=1410619 RepID=UPI0003FCCDBC|nr:fimbrial protein [Serratia sp. DD3]
MAQSNNYLQLFIVMGGSLIGGQAIASTPIGSAGTTQFVATINDGSCDLDYTSGHALAFMPRMATDFSPGKTVEIQPINIDIQCNYTVTPQVMITGKTPYPGNQKVFLDTNSQWPTNTNGVGFMVQPATSVAARDTPPSLSDFYVNGLAGKAIANGETMMLLPLNSANGFSENQVLWVGLVGMVDSNQITPGAFQATITITGIIP